MNVAKPAATGFFSTLIREGSVKRTALYILIVAVVAAAIVLPITHPWQHEERVTIKVLCAGSLLVPFDQGTENMKTEFEQLHPNVEVLIEGHGSIQAIRDATEVAEIAGVPGADVVAVAGHSLIPLVMYNRQVPGTTEKYADWYLKFATNNVGLAYTPTSKCADDLSATNWYEILARDGVTFGFSDPRFDACGYRTLMVCQLAELYYEGEPTIFEDLITSNFELR